MNIFNKKGFNLIEVIIAIVIISLIVSSYSYLFSLSIDLPIISNKSKALYYAQKEMEKLNNTQYQLITNIQRTNYQPDPNYDYEIKVDENIYFNKKDVWIYFYYKDDNKKLVELYSKFIKLERVEICDDFQDGNFDAPPWNWTTQPPGQWSLVIFPTNSGNYRANYRRRQSGFMYPDWIGSSNYTLSVDFYITSTFSINSSRLRFYGRYNNNTDNGYFVEIETYFSWLFDEYTYIYLYKVVNGINYLLGQYYLYYSIFNDWHNIRLKMVQNRLYVYFDGEQTPIIAAEDNQFTSGSIRISVESQLRSNNVYFDNICVKEVP